MVHHPHPAPPASAGATRPDTLRLFDCLAPFFVAHPAGGVVNWSKIPFASLERDGVLDAATVETVVPEFEGYVATMASLGYNAVAIDDLAHLVPHEFYPDRLRRKLASYAALYERLFATIKAHGLKLFVITDYMVFNDAIERHLAAGGGSAADLFAETVEAAFAAYPALDGVVLRIGESDGVDVRADFGSRLTLTRPREARALLRRLLPLFEARGKTLVFRTWTLGAYPIGDLMWNPRTYDAVFAGIDSPNLVVSLKYGDSDFFRYLAVNPLFFRGGQRKIVELQCRREYEGMGEFPSFVGRLYADYLAALEHPGCNLVGIYALQGGGWAPFRRTAFCAGGSLWNELNAYVTVKLFLDRAPVEEIVADFCRWRGIRDVGDFLRLLRLSDRAIEEGLYVREFARRTVYFRRVRVPPVTWVFWNNVTTGGLVGKLYRSLVRDKPAAVAEGHRAVEDVREMLRIAERLGLPTDGIAFQLDTFRALALLREVLLGLATPGTRARLEALLAGYRGRYPDGYVFDEAGAAGDRSDRLAGLLFGLVIRHRTQYRRWDRLLLNRHVARLKTVVARGAHLGLPRFVDKQGMTSDVLLR